MIRAAICENEEEDLQTLQYFIESSDEIVDFTVYQNPEPLLWDIKTDRIYFDIFFVGSKINNLDGMEIAKHIKLIDKNAIIIFIIEDSSCYKIDNQQLLFGCLTKPFNNLQFERVFQRAAERAKQMQTQVFSTVHLGLTYGIRHASIAYISNKDNKILIHLRSKEARLYGGVFSDFISLLSNKQFVRCHKNYIVNLSCVTDFFEHEFYLADVSIPISRKYLALARESYNKHLFAIFEQE